jgi:cell wall-associated NlpC family hydrolase
MVRAFFRQCFSLELPDLKGCQFQGPEEARSALDALALSYREIPSGQEQPGDVLLLRGQPCHVALVVVPGLMLHVDRGCATCIEPYRSGVWKTRVLGIYRHEQLAS